MRDQDVLERRDIVLADDGDKVGPRRLELLGCDVVLRRYRRREGECRLRPDVARVLVAAVEGKEACAEDDYRGGTSAGRPRCESKPTEGGTEHRG